MRRIQNYFDFVQTLSGIKKKITNNKFIVPVRICKPPYIRKSKSKKTTNARIKAIIQIFFFTQMGEEIFKQISGSNGKTKIFAGLWSLSFS